MLAQQGPTLRAQAGDADHRRAATVALAFGRGRVESAIANRCESLRARVLLRVVGGEENIAIRNRFALESDSAGHA